LASFDTETRIISNKMVPFVGVFRCSN